MKIDLCYAECKRLSEIAQQYRSCCVQTYDEISKNVVRYEYGKGGECIHRGYYCPSTIHDVVVGNVRRGRRIKNRKENQEIIYIYGFDNANRLLTVDKVEGDTREFILYQGNLQIGIMFDKDWSNVRAVLECLYDENGKILTFKYGSVDFETCEVHDFDIENYRYSKNGLAVDWHQFLDCWRKPRFGYRYHYWCDKYYFSVVDGYLSTYTTEHFTEQGKQESIWDGHVFKVYERRKYQG